MAEGQEIIKAKLLQPLSKLELGLEILQREADSLVRTEDNIEEIRRFLEKGSRAMKAVADKHKAEKEPYLRRCQEYDTAKKTIEGLVQDIFNPVRGEYQRLCKAAEERKKALQAEELRVSSIKKGINENVISFSEKIKACKTIQELVDAERLINLEKSRKEKYGDQLPYAIERYNTLTEGIKEQKNNIKALEKNTDISEDAAIAMAQRIKDKADQINLNAVESGSNKFPWELVKEDVPEVKAKRSVWKWENVGINLNDTKIKTPVFTKLVLDEVRINAFLESLKKNGSLKDKEEYVFEGIRFFLSKTY